MSGILLVCGLIFVVLMINEVLWRKKILSGELSRKFVHIIVGVIMAFSALVLSYEEIQILCLAFVIVILVSTKLRIFNSIRAVKRDTSGELFFALGIAVCALFEPEVWIYVAAILHLALADSVAALVGVRWGKTTGYKFLGNKKSIMGTSFFFLSSLSILLSVMFLTEHLANVPVALVLVAVPTILTLLENVSWHGIDNLTVPVTALALITYLSN